MPKKGLTEIVVIMDKSGSMSSTRMDAMGGFNTFLEEQKKGEGEAKLTLVLFDTDYNRLYDNLSISEAQPLTETTYVPGGQTALLDAIGRTIDKMGERLGQIPEDKRPEKIIVVIITDGEENSSVEYKKPQINEKIKTQLETYKWEFIFLGANQNAIKEGGSLGIQVDNIMNYNEGNINLAYSAVSRSVTSSRAGETVAFTEVEKSDAISD